MAIAADAFGRPTVFEPQKVVANQRLRITASALLLVVVTLTLLAFA